MSRHFKYDPVLVLGASPRISLTIARSLHRHGVPVDIASFQPEEPDLHSRAIRQFHRLPSRSQDPVAFSTALASLVREKGFDLLLPAGDPALAALRDLYHELSPLLHVGCPPPRSVDRVLNKSLTLETAQGCGIRVPATCAIASLKELDSVAPQLRFPVVAKPKQKGAAAFRVFYFNDLSELSSAIKRNNWGSILLQEYCPGVGVGIEILIHNRECVAKFQHRRLKEAPATGGVAVLAISEEPDPEMLQSSMALLRALEWEGVAMVEYRVDRASGSVALMEVNGRFWGSLSLPVLVGVDFPLYYWQLAHGEHPEVPDRYPVGTRWRWSPGYLERAQSLIALPRRGNEPRASTLRELLRIPVDFSPFIKEALWSWSDPLPFLAEMSGTIRSLMVRALRSLSHGCWRRLVKSHAGSISELRLKADRSAVHFDSAISSGSTPTSDTCAPDTSEVVK